MFTLFGRIKTVTRWISAAFFTLLGLSSSFAYTTVGFDFETPTAQGINVRYYRLRWDDGSFWLGLAVQPCLRPDHAPDWFDPGGTLFASPTRPVHRTWWNSLGFWRIFRVEEDPYETVRYPGATLSSWWACPAWLSVLPFWIGPIWRSRKKKSRLVESKAHPDGIVTLRYSRRDVAGGKMP